MMCIRVQISPPDAQIKVQISPHDAQIRVQILLSDAHIRVKISFPDAQIKAQILIAFLVFTENSSVFADVELRTHCN